MHMNRRNTRGFTLVEILIVVIILGILAAIVIPQFTNASQDARVSSLQSLTQTLRSQIELFKLQHGDTLPNIVGSTGTQWNPFTTLTYYPSSAADFSVAITGSKSYGPYMQSAPVNPLNQSGAVVDAGLATVGAAKPTTPPAGTYGWAYDYNSGAGTGRIWGYHPTGSATSGPTLLD